MASERRPLPGSEFSPLEDAAHEGPVAGDEELLVTVVVRPATDALGHHHDHPRWEQHPHEREAAAEEHRRGRYASEEDLERVRTFAKQHGLSVVEASPRRRVVLLEGSASAMTAAFGVELVRYSHQRGDHHGHEGPIHLPEELHGIVVAVLGLNDRPIAHKQMPGAAAGAPRRRLSATELAEIYDFPAEFDGSGQKIGIIELSDHRHPCGYDSDDLKTFFDSLGLPSPEVRDVVRHGSSNDPEDPKDVAKFMQWVSAVANDPGSAAAPPRKGRATAEVVMDIELAGALAPGAEIVVYFAPNTEGGVYHVLHDILEAGEVSIISFSWAWEVQHDSFEDLIADLLQRAADPGGDHRPPITFCTASGDYGGSKLCFPAVSPWALSCGGTRLVEAEEGFREAVWNTREAEAASGGGVGRTPQPSWQKGLEPSTGRGVPDVAMVADPASHCDIFVGGVWGPAAGTSAAAPLWAALVARINQALGVAQGYLNPRLYAVARRRPGTFRSVTEGDNVVKGEGFEAREGWDPCTGLGSPRGGELLEALRPSS